MMKSIMAKALEKFPLNMHIAPRGHLDYTK